MADKAKGPVILLIFLLLVTVAAAFLGFMGLQKEKQRNVVLQEKVEQLEVKKRSAEKQVADLRQQLDDLKQQLAQQQAKIQDFDNQIKWLNDELSVEKKTKEEALLEAEKLKEGIASLESAKSNLEAELKTGQEALGSLQDKLAVLEKSREGLKNKPGDLEVKSQDVQLEKIVIASSSDNIQRPEGHGLASSSQSQNPNTPVTAQAALPQAPLEGKVLVVNREYDFVVVNLGQKDNVNIADTLDIFRKDKKIGELRIEEVRDTMSVATPVVQGIIKQIKEDDKVVRGGG